MSETFSFTNDAFVDSKDGNIVASPQSGTLSVYLKNQYDFFCFRSLNSFSIEGINPAKFRIAKDNYFNYRLERILCFIIGRNPKTDHFKHRYSYLWEIKTFQISTV